MTTSKQRPTARFRPRRLALANDEALVLSADGTVERMDAAGLVLEHWAQDDPGWADQAIRFGIHPSPTTVPPRGRYVPDSKPAA